VDKAYLLTGANGMLAADLRRVLADRPVTALGRAELDITDADAVDAAVAGHDVVVNCAAYTRVDDAETDEATAFAVNADGAENLARAARATGAVLLQVSTDYVFDGTATEPYPEDAPPHPLSAYGRSKAEGELLALEANPGRTVIVRTAWLYGAHGPNFPAAMLRLATRGEPFRVVDDQIGQPTWSWDLAQRLAQIADAGIETGILHATNSGSTSRFEFARAVLEDAGFDPDLVEPTTSASFPQPAPRPPYSVLDHAGWAAIAMPPMRDWRSAIAEAIARGAVSAS
jgi:dTDP-4-dehydrorhamnose reductase